MQHIQARYFTKGPRNRRIDWVVLHDMEALNLSTTAENVGKYFANLPKNLPKHRMSSAHIGCDLDSPCRYVNDNDIAYAAPGANERGLHLELAGFARFLRGEWNSTDIKQMLAIAAPIVRRWCQQFNIPMIFVNAVDLRRGKRGITTHYEVSQAFRLTSHTDPGRGFPIAEFISAVANPAPLNLQEASKMTGSTAVEILTTASGNGYVIVASDGGVFCYGDAEFHGSMGGQKMNAPIIGATMHFSGKGYWLLGEDGGVFAFGAAQFYGAATEHI